MNQESIECQEEQALRSTSRSDRLRYGIPDDATFDDVVRTLCWGTFGIEGLGPMKVIRLIDASTAHLENILATQHHIGELYSRVILNILRSRHGRKVEPFVIATGSLDDLRSYSERSLVEMQCKLHRIFEVAIASVRQSFTEEQVVKVTTGVFTSFAEALHRRGH